MGPIVKKNRRGKKLAEKALIPLPPTEFACFFCAIRKRVRTVPQIMQAGGFKEGAPFSHCASLCEGMLKPCTENVHITSTPATNMPVIFPKYLPNLWFLRVFPMYSAPSLGLVISRSRVRLLVPAPYKASQTVCTVFEAPEKPAFWRVFSFQCLTRTKAVN